MKADYINFVYLIAAVLFILGLKGLTHPRTAVRGNLLGAAGMAVAVLVVLFDDRFDDKFSGYFLVFVGIAIGAAAGTTLAQRIEMTAMPQLVALFNGFGGGASVLGNWAQAIGFPVGGWQVPLATSIIVTPELVQLFTSSVAPNPSFHIAIALLSSAVVTLALLSHTRSWAGRGG